jgi:hypothetical protein
MEPDEFAEQVWQNAKNFYFDSVEGVYSEDYYRRK